MYICVYVHQKEEIEARLCHRSVDVGHLLLLLLLLSVSVLELGFHADKQQGANGIGEMLIVLHEQSKTARVNAQHLGVGSRGLQRQLGLDRGGGLLGVVVGVVGGAPETLQETAFSEESTTRICPGLAGWAGG